MGLLLWGKQVTGYCIHLARAYEKMDPEDLAQDLAILAWKLRSRPKPYVKVALRHRAIDYARRRGRERRIFSGDGLESCARIADKRAEKGLLAHVDLSEAIDRGGGLILGILQGLSMRELAKLSGVSAKTIHKRLSRIRPPF